jgi:hypothetical protein
MKAVTTASRARVLALFFGVLGDPTRLTLIQELEGGERSLGQLVAQLASHRRAGRLMTDSRSHTWRRST